MNWTGWDLMWTVVLGLLVHFIGKALEKPFSRTFESLQKWRIERNERRRDESAGRIKKLVSGTTPLLFAKIDCVELRQIIWARLVIGILLLASGFAFITNPVEYSGVAPGGSYIRGHAMLAAPALACFTFGFAALFSGMRTTLALLNSLFEIRRARQILEETENRPI